MSRLADYVPIKIDGDDYFIVIDLEYYDRVLGTDYWVYYCKLYRAVKITKRSLLGKIKTVETTEQVFDFKSYWLYFYERDYRDLNSVTRLFCDMYKRSVARRKSIEEFNSDVIVKEY